MALFHVYAFCPRSHIYIPPSAYALKHVRFVANRHDLIILWRLLFTTAQPVTKPPCRRNKHVLKTCPDAPQCEFISRSTTWLARYCTVVAVVYQTEAQVAPCGRHKVAEYQPECQPAEAPADTRTVRMVRSNTYTGRLRASTIAILVYCESMKQDARHLLTYFIFCMVRSDADTGCTPRLNRSYSGLQREYDARRVTRQ